MIVRIVTRDTTFWDIRSQFISIDIYIKIIIIIYRSRVKIHFKHNNYCCCSTLTVIKHIIIILCTYVIIKNMYIYAVRIAGCRYNYYHIQKVLRTFSIVPLPTPPRLLLPLFSYFPSLVPNTFHLGTYRIFIVYII